MTTATIDWTTTPPADFRAGSLTFGNFDGVHQGHRELVTATAHEARKVGGPAVVVTFDPPPRAVLDPRAVKPPLSTPADRAERLLSVGADRVVTLRTDAGLLALTPADFVTNVVVGLFRAKAVVEGFNFRFGRGRSGDTAQLRQLCDRHGVAFAEVPPLLLGGSAVSSSRVRAAVQTGDVTTAAALLGRAYSVRGVVEAGAKRGRTIGFPTANLGGVHTLLPGDGVYAVRTTAGGQPVVGAANVGPNPTFGEHARKVEVHLLDFAGDLYGQELRVEFVQRLRGTRPFAGAGELVEQLRQDVAAARAAVG